MRIRTILFFIASIFLFSCQRKANDRLAILALQVACNDEWAEIENKSGFIEELTYKEGGRKADLRVLADSKRIAKWKRSAIPSLSVSGLKQYADSLIFWNNIVEKKLSNSTFPDKKDLASSVLSDIQSGRTEIPTKLITQTDSLLYYEFLYLLMRKESELQSWLSGKMLSEGLDNSSTSKLKYTVNDTAKLVIRFRYYPYEGKLIHYRVKSLQLTHQNKPTNIIPTVEIIGKYVILKFIAQQKGTYIVNGIITGTYPESKKEELAPSIYEHIIVE